MDINISHHILSKQYARNFPKLSSISKRPRLRNHPANWLRRGHFTKNATFNVNKFRTYNCPPFWARWWTPSLSRFCKDHCKDFEAYSWLFGERQFAVSTPSMWNQPWEILLWCGIQQPLIQYSLSVWSCMMICPIYNRHSVCCGTSIPACIVPVKTLLYSFLQKHWPRR